jgi:hypothetical protein
MTEALHTTYSYKLSKANLYTSGGEVLDISQTIIELNLYEDLFSPCMTGMIRLGDGAELISTFKLHGNEFIELELDKPTLNKPMKKVFRIYKISDRDSDGGVQNYTLHLCSEEMILSPQIMISKSYKGLNISAMVNDILLNYLKVDKKKIGHITQTSSNYDIIIPRMNPFEAIMWLGTRAYSPKGTLYFFYENRDGFNFSSYEDLLAKPSYATYSERDKTDGDVIKNSYTFTYLKIIEDFDIMKASRYGSFSSSLNTLDIITKQFKPFKFNSVDLKNTGILNKEVTLNGFKNRLGTTFYDSYSNMMKYVVVKDSDPNVNPAVPQDWMCQTISKLGQLHLFKMIGTVPGDILLKTGMVIDVEVQKYNPQEQAVELNKVRSGKYLVSAVHHRFIGDVYTCSIELLSDSISDYMPVPVNNSTKLNELIKS